MIGRKKRWPLCCFVVINVKCKVAIKLEFMIDVKVSISGNRKFRRLKLLRIKILIIIVST